jgi:lysophospholipase L1-like esterase
MRATVDLFAGLVKIGAMAGRARWKDLVVSLAAVLVTLLLLELGLRLFHRPILLSSEWILEDQTRVWEDDTLNAPSRLLRDRFYERAAGGKVVVALGDSFTVGFPVAADAAWPARLEALAGARVLNAGIGDSGPDQQLRVFTKHVLPRVKPDVVIWQLYANDSFDNAIKPLFTISDGKLRPVSAHDNWMYRRQRLYRALPLGRRSMLVRLLLATFERDRAALVPAGVDPPDWGRRKIALALDEMEALAARHGFRVYYTIVEPEALCPGDIAEGSSGAWERTEHGRLLPLVEGRPGFIPVHFGDPALYADGTRDPNATGSHHLNEAGYDRLARAIAERLSRDGALR